MTLARTEGPDGLEKGTTLSHLIGTKDEDVHFLPDLSKTAEVVQDVTCFGCGHTGDWSEHQNTCDNCGTVLDETNSTLNLGPSGHTGKTARRDFSEREKYALIEEDGEARNVHKLDTTGTHYEDQSAAEIARMILPLKGL